MSYRAIYAYPWNLADEGVSAVVDAVRALGIDTITSPAATTPASFSATDGKERSIFPTTARSISRPIRRVTAPSSRRSTACSRARRAVAKWPGASRVAVNVWLVLLHNTRLGALIRSRRSATRSATLTSTASVLLRRMRATTRRARQGRHRELRCGRHLDRDAGLSALSHGYHHEFAMVKSNPWLDSMLGLCFCDHCLREAPTAGIDARGLQARVRAEIDAYLSSDIDFPDDMAEAFWRVTSRADGELTRYLDLRIDGRDLAGRGDSRRTVRADASVAVIPSVARPTGGAWYEGSDLHALATTAGIIEACFYEPSAMRVKADLFDTKRRLKGAGKLRGIIGPGFPDLVSRTEVVEAAQALRDAGISEVAFYNYGHLRRSNIDWIADALAVFGDG